MPLPSRRTLPTLWRWPCATCKWSGCGDASGCRGKRNLPGRGRLKRIRIPPVEGLPFEWAAQRVARRHASKRLRSEEHTSELQSQSNLVCRLLLEKKKKTHNISDTNICTSRCL